MMDSYLSAQQLKALDPTIRLIEAGPGAGKTRTVVERFRNVASQPGQFAALVSFTNSAVNEVRKRCASQPHLLKPPNFVGTFDSFFHRFVTTPAYLRTRNKQPRYVASWDDLPDHLSRVRPPAGGRGFPLTAFELTQDSGPRLVPERLKRMDNLAWKKLSAYTQRNLVLEALARQKRLTNAGIMSAATARDYALSILRTSEGQRVIKRLSHRFSEIIVDEFQDCNETDVHLLNLLRENDVSVITVADPDQAIYRFRQVGSENIYHEFRSTVPDSSIAPLNECYRSSQVICSVATSLRSVSPDPVLASQPATEGAPHIFVIKSRLNEVINRANSILLSQGIETKNSRVIAHSDNDARRLIDNQQGFKGNSTARRILQAILELRGRGTVSCRLSALDVLSRIILSAVDQSDNSEASTMSETLIRLGIDPIVLRILSNRLVTASVHWRTAEDYATSFSAIITEGLNEFGLTPKSNLKRTFPKPKVDLWELWISLSAGLANVELKDWSWSNIHQAKGGEFEAVLLSIPSKSRPGNTHPLDDWENDVMSEQRRVLYVGASRARRTLIFWPEGQRFAQLTRIFKRDGIPYVEV